MIKLRDAKCPNCGANIQVNDKLESTICQYCGSQVLIEEAIEQYKIELSGSVEVDGIQGRSSKIRNAKKHIKIGEYAEARSILQSLTYENSLDTEAYIELLKLEIIEIRAKGFNADSVVEDNLNWKKDLTEIRDTYDRIKKIDDEHIAETELIECNDDIEKCIAYLESINNFITERDEQIAREKREQEEREEQARREKEIYTNEFNTLSDEVTEKLNNYLERADAISGDDDGCYNGFVDMVKDAFRVGDGKQLSFVGKNNKYYKFNQELITIEELKTKSETLFEKIEPFLQEYAKKRNIEIDKYNKEVDKTGKIIKKKKRPRKTEIRCFYFVIILFIGIVILTAIQNGILNAIVFGLVWDSWIIPLSIKAIKTRKEDLKQYDKEFEENQSRKLEHVH